MLDFGGYSGRFRMRARNTESFDQRLNATVLPLNLKVSAW